jgi:hypothetical protein
MFTVKPMPKTKMYNKKKYDLVAETFDTKASAEKAAKFFAPMYYTKIVPHQYEGIKLRYYALYVREKPSK